MSENEIKQLLRIIIDEYEIRSRLPKRDIFRASSESIVASLNRSECMQLILLSDDINIVRAIDQLVYSKVIDIPPSEVRESVLKRFNGQYNIYHQCNKLGVRSTSKNQDLAMVRLKKLIKNVYDDIYLKPQIEWKLRPFSGDTIDAKLEKYISSSDPKKIIYDTIMNGPVQLERTFRILPGQYVMPDTTDMEMHLVEKILWKLGFEVNIFPDELDKFWSRLRKFKDSVSRSLRYNEEDKDEIRSSAVNLFVSLERILEQTLSFVTWMLLADHYIDTNFEYVYEDTRDFMTLQLNNFEMSSGDKLLFDSGGKNTLFPLIAGFDALISICNNLLAKGPDEHKRPDSEIPDFYNKDSLRVFPFMSKKMIFDISASDYNVVVSLIKDISKDFSKANVLSIRNRLQHKRDDFPVQEEMLDACDAIDRVVSLLDNSNMYPSVYLFDSYYVDEYRRDEYRYKNYKGVKVKINPSAEYGSCNLPSFDVPQIIVPCVNIGGSSYPFRFEYKEKSEYQQFWKNYPRRRK